MLELFAELVFDLLACPVEFWTLAGRWSGTLPS